MSLDTPRAKAEAEQASSRPPMMGVIAIYCIGLVVGSMVTWLVMR